MMDRTTFDYVLQLADDALILGHRNSEWCGHVPALEQDIAITNISLDLIGQARYFYQYAARLQGGDTTEDTLAYRRDARQYTNHLVCEQPNGDWGRTILRQFIVSNYQQELYNALLQSSDAEIAAIAGKAIKEVNYHYRWSSEWVIRLGDGTDESHARMISAMNDLWMYTGELFIPSIVQQRAAEAGIGPAVDGLRSAWDAKTLQIFEEARLPLPDKTFAQTGGKTGMHTEHLGFILAELQYLQRSYPGNKW
jgi:ring-1,2-phenylacetyl-CoA epoxidase subunit PaaC